MVSKDILSAVACILTVIAFFPYIQSIAKGKTKPHVFSWIIWGITTLIAAAVQGVAGGGAGAWATAFSGVLTVGIAAVAYFEKSDITITRLDWAFFLSALAVLPLWYGSADAFLAIVFLTIVDGLGFLPTLRKSYHDPYSENVEMYVLIFIRNGLAMLALERYSLTTLFFPAVMSGIILILVPLILIRRLRH